MLLCVFLLLRLAIVIEGFLSLDGDVLCILHNKTAGLTFPV